MSFDKSFVALYVDSHFVGPFTMGRTSANDDGHYPWGDAECMPSRAGGENSGVVVYRGSLRLTWQPSSGAPEAADQAAAGRAIPPSRLEALWVADADVGQEHPIILDCMSRCTYDFARSRVTVPAPCPDIGSDESGGEHEGEYEFYLEDANAVDSVKAHASSPTIADAGACAPAASACHGGGGSWVRREHGPPDPREGWVQGPDEQWRRSRDVELIREEFVRRWPLGMAGLSRLPALVETGADLPVGRLLEVLKRGVNERVKARMQVTLYNNRSRSVNKYTYRLRCVCHGKPSRTKVTRGSGCDWWVAYELTLEGWVLAAASKAACGQRDDHTQPSSDLGYGRHNHPLYANDAEASANPAYTRLSDEANDEYYHLAQEQASCGAQVAWIHKVLKHKWDMNNGPDGMPMPWDYQHIRHHFNPSGNKAEMDLTGLMALLQKRKDEERLEYSHDYDEATHTINRLWVELRGGRDDWARGGSDNALLFDPTHGTNVYKFKLCLFCTVSDNGKTVILAWAALESEGRLDFEWAFQSFARVFPTPPRVVFTDHDTQIEGAIEHMKTKGWPNTRHHLCVYHISQNLWKRLRSSFLGDDGSNNWRAVHDRFWRIVKNTDESFRGELFNQEWRELVDLVARTATNQTTDHHTNVDWLRQLGANHREQFVYSYTWSVCTLTVNSTQRSEAMQRVVKENIGLTGKTRLTDLTEKADAYNDARRREHDVDDVRRMCKQALSSMSLQPTVQRLRESLSTFAFALVLSQSQESLHYRIDDPRGSGRRG